MILKSLKPETELWLYMLWSMLSLW